MVGRQHERAVITEALQELEAGIGGALVVHGDTGLGKTRLVQEAVAEAGPRCAVGAGQRILLDRDLAYAPIFEALTRHVDHTGPAERAAPRRS